MNNKKQEKSSNANNKMRFSAQVLLVSFVLTATIFLLLIETFKTYRSTVTIIVNAKSEIAAQQESAIIGNILEIPKTLAFYDRLLKFNTDVRDVAQGKNPDQRKTAWNKMLEVQEINGEATLIKISIVSSAENDAEALARKTTRTLFDSVSQYYDVKKDIDMRVVDGPISHPIFSYWYVALLLSALMGISIAFLLENAMFQLKSMLAKSVDLKNKKFFNFNDFGKFPNHQKDSENKAAPATAEKESAEKKSSHSSEMEALNKIIEQDIYPNFPEMPVSSAQKSSAPDNLPIGDDSLFFAQMPQSQEEKKSEPKTSEQPIQEQEEEQKTHEPTPEELKKRLNQLLKGEL